MKNQKKWTLHAIVAVGMMAAFIFAATRFLSIPLMLPTGKIMLKTANALCLLGGMLFGGVQGGLAAGLGSALFDLTDPAYAPMAWLVFIRFFLMAFLCGKIAHARGAQGKNPAQNLIAGTVGAVFSSAFYVVQKIVMLLLGGSAFLPAVAAVSPALVITLINTVFAIVAAQILAPALRRALSATPFFQKVQQH